MSGLAFIVCGSIIWALLPAITGTPPRGTLTDYLIFLCLGAVIAFTERRVRKGHGR